MLAAAGLLMLAGCGGSDDPQLTVFAATSLENAFQTYAGSFKGADVRIGAFVTAACVSNVAKPNGFGHHVSSSSM